MIVMCCDFENRDELHMLKVDSEVNLDKLQRVDELANSVGLTNTPLMMAHRQLKSIVKGPSQFGAWYWQLFSYALSSPTAAILFFSGTPSSAPWNRMFSVEHWNLLGEGWISIQCCSSVVHKSIWFKVFSLPNLVPFDRQDFLGIRCSHVFWWLIAGICVCHQGVITNMHWIAIVWYPGNYWDAVLSLILGLGVGILALVPPISPVFGNMLEFISALFVSFLARVFSHHLPNLEVCFFAMAMSGLVWLLPGLYRLNVIFSI